MEKEKITIRKVLCLVHQMEKGQSGFIKATDLVFYLTNERYFRCIKLNAKVYEFDGTNSDFFIEKRDDNVLEGESYYIEEGYGYAIEPLEYFKFNPKIFTTPVEIEIEEESFDEKECSFDKDDDLNDEDGNWKVSKSNPQKLSKKENVIRFLEDLTEESLVSDLETGIRLAIEIEDYETCIFLQKWIQKAQGEKKRREYLLSLFRRLLFSDSFDHRSPL